MKRALLLTILFAAAPIVTRAYAADLLLRLGPEELVQAGGADISVLGYSVPSLADWDNDGLNDLIVGEGSGSYSTLTVNPFKLLVICLGDVNAVDAN